MSDDQPTEPVGTPWWSQPSGDVWSAPRPLVAAPYAGEHHTTPYAAPPVVQERRRRILPLVLVVALLAGVIGGAVGGFVGVRLARETTAVNLGTSPAGRVLARPPGSVAAIAKAVLPSVVSINVQGSGQSDTGSGIVLSADGYILTNNHVVAAASDGGSIQVVFYSKQTASATIVGTDPQSDLAVVKAQGVSGLRPARLGNSSTLQVGDLVVAIGSPLGLSGTVTMGIVSAKDRPVTTGQGSGTQAVIDAIQTDAAINPGNSGGPLVDDTGRVVGINSAIATLGGSNTFGGQGGSIGLGFAIPIDQARSIAAELIRTGHATHPIIGVQAESVGPDQARQIPGGTTGALVRSVVPGGGAAKAGLKPGDIITAVDGVRITGVDQLVVEIRKHRVGDTVRVTYVRGGTSHTVPVTLGSDSG